MIEYSWVSIKDVRNLGIESGCVLFKTVKRANAHNTLRNLKFSCHLRLYVWHKAVCSTWLCRANMTTLRRSLRLQGAAPESDHQTDEKCFFCLLPTRAFAKCTVYLSCCRRFVHRRCQVAWEEVTNRDSCGHCRQSLEWLFSLRTLSHREVVQAMQTILNNETIIQNLRLVSTVILLHGRV